MNEEKEECSRCGYTEHFNGKCPAFGKKCAICSKYNHFAKVCRTKVQQVQAACNDYESGEYNESDSDDDSSDDDDYCFLRRCVNDHVEMIRICDHNVYRACFLKSVMESDEIEVRCPYKFDNRYECKKDIRMFELKRVLSSEEYADLLKKKELLNERNCEYTYECKNQHCTGWWVYQGSPKVVQCPVCAKINCLLCKSLHDGQPCKALEDDLNYPNENNTATLKTRKEKTEIYPALLDLYRAQLVSYTQEFECPICFEQVLPMEGIILKECLHVFCRHCLRGTIQASDKEDVRCPYSDDNSPCSSFILEEEIRALLSAEEYQKRLDKCLLWAEAKAPNSFHCTTPNCKGWCEVEEDAEEFECDICWKISCIICSVNHESMTCLEYQNSIVNKASVDKIEEMIMAGLAMKCPQCSAVLQKVDGCDGITCPFCDLDICWVTKRPRWGPKGKGDWSGGCRCGYDGRMCHPACGNCH